MQAYRVSNDYQARGFRLRAQGDLWERFYAAHQDPLTLGCPLLNQRRGGLVAQAMCDELSADDRKCLQSHVEDERLPWPRERVPGQIQIRASEVASG